jgi:integrase
MMRYVSIALKTRPDQHFPRWPSSDAALGGGTRPTPAGVSPTTRAVLTVADECQCAWRCWATGTSSPRSAVAASWTSPPTRWTLSGILGLAVCDRRLAVNPALGVALPPMQEKRRRYLTAEQLEALADAAGPGRVAVLVLGYCGLRWSELAALRCGTSTCYAGGCSSRRPPPRSTAPAWCGAPPRPTGRRSVPLPLLVDELAHGGDPPLPTSWPSPRRKVRCCATGTPGPPGSTQPPGHRGARAHPARAAPHRGVARAQAGANVKAVQRMLGHASAAMTLDRYADLFDDDLDDVADRLDALQAASRGRVADFLRTDTPSEGSPEPPTEVKPQVRGVETRGIEPLTPALQRRCSAN